MSLVPETDFDARAKDWRCGPVVYQIFVDRFVPPKDVDAKRRLLRPGQSMRRWDEQPRPGVRDERLKRWSHEMEFWGGDLQGVQSKLDYLKTFGADVLYMTPVFKAYTNHRYDGEDFRQIDPLAGSLDDLKSLVKAAHAKKLKVMLDGVFNHVGDRSPMFQSAMKGPGSRFRDWFTFGPEHAHGYDAWYGIASLPALNLTSPAVQNYFWKGRDSIVKRYLELGVDGWRLDVGFDLGPEVLGAITRSAHAAKPGSAVIGEISGYPADWFPAVDGVFNFMAPQLGARACRGELTGGQVGQALQDMVDDAGIENVLRSWLLVDNHDTPRFANQVPIAEDRRLVTALQMTLPGCPLVYYGTEVDMLGGGDPACRGPMPWDLVSKKSGPYNWYRKLIDLRRRVRSLRIGDFRSLRTNQLIAYVRTTDKVLESALVVVNPTAMEVTESFPSRIGRVMSWGGLKDAIGGETVTSVNGIVNVTMKPKSVAVYVPVDTSMNGYRPYRRVP